MARLNIDFVLIDESVVMYGFRVLMSGAQLENFKKNPVLLAMHSRLEGNHRSVTEQDLPIGKWYDIRVEGNKLLAKPDFDDDDEFAQKIQKKVEKGYLNGASIWIDPISVSDDEALKLPGQVGPTVTKWGLFEASVVDIPNCKNALAIRTRAGKKVALSLGSENEEINFYLNSLVPGKPIDLKHIRIVLGLPNLATDEQVAHKLTVLVQKASKATALQLEKLNLQNKISELNTRIEVCKMDRMNRAKLSLIDGAIKDRKLCAGDRAKYLKLADADFETVKRLISEMQPYQSAETRLAMAAHMAGSELAELLKLSGRELYLSGKLERLKKLSLYDFKLKYQDYYGQAYAEVQ